MKLMVKDLKESMSQLKAFIGDKGYCIYLPIKIIKKKFCHDATIKNDNIESKCKWSPFNGDKFKGTPVATIIRGEVKMKDGKIIGDPSGKPLEFN